MQEVTRLLSHLRGSGPVDRRLERLLDWLGGAVGGTAQLTGTPGGARLPPEAAETAEQLTAGRLRSAALQDGSRHLRLTAIGPEPPYAVLTVARSEPFDGRAGALVTAAVDLIGSLVELRAAAADRERLRTVAAALRVAVFQLLMGGEVTLAQRTSEGLTAGLLDAEQQRVYVLEGPAAERDELALRCTEATAGQALVVRCPAYDQHLIVVAPLRGPVTEDGWDRVGLALRDFVADRPDRFLGGSGRLPLAQTAGCYGDATRALAVARLQPGRAALYAAESRLAEVLDPRAAAAWADALLRPLHALPLSGRDQLLGTLHLGLEFPATSAAKIIGISRNTVRARLDRAGDLLGLDLTGVRERAVLHLALRMAGRDGAAAAPVPPVEVPAEVLTEALVEVLTAPPSVEWAGTLLDRLSEDGRELRRTLLGWLRANCGVDLTATALDLHPQTVRDHLRAAERLLQRQLLSGGGGVYEVVLAFTALGELPPVHG
ncbi:helix-turn-helix domain-containing protein [Kitasatospora sp. NPDC002040]|uniref:helix-turn-helix domain-containing protein n=1 Tax=Kitasatospora sp. NPDC002040 TaxID=3154661 RepID=UPI003330DCAC